MRVRIASPFAMWCEEGGKDPDGGNHFIIMHRLYDSEMVTGSCHHTVFQLGPSLRISVLLAG